MQNLEISWRPDLLRVAAAAAAAAARKLMRL